MEIDRLREGHGDFATADEFYQYWRAFPFRTSNGIQNACAVVEDFWQDVTESRLGYFIRLDGGVHRER